MHVCGVCRLCVHSGLGHFFYGCCQDCALDFWKIWSIADRILPHHQHNQWHQKQCNKNCHGLHFLHKRDFSVMGCGYLAKRTRVKEGRKSAVQMHPISTASGISLEPTLGTRVGHEELLSEVGS